MNETKLPACQDCKHCFSDFGNASCRLFPVRKWDAKTGEYETIAYLDIYRARQDKSWQLSDLDGFIASCGRAGRLFEPKPTLTARLHDFITKLNIMLHCALPN